VIDTILVAAALVVLLGIEWRYQLRAVRLATIALALIVWYFSLPNLTIAARWASTAPPEERVTHLRGEEMSEYLVGVATMREAMSGQIEARSHTRLLAIGALIWLACSPAIRREHARTRATSA